MMQTPSQRETLERSLIVPLSMRYEDRRRTIGKEVASTKVDFFTMVRGD